MESTVSPEIFWITLALINAGLAETKNRSRWYWFLWSLLLGPIATFLIVTWPPRETPIAALRPEKSNTVGSRD